MADPVFIRDGYCFQQAVAMLSEGHSTIQVQDWLDKQGSIWDYSGVVQTLAGYWLETNSDGH